MTVDPEAFNLFEHRGWERVAGSYDAVWASLTRPFVEPLLEATKVGAGMRLLDVACGPGYVAEAAARLGADVLGVDFSREMVRQARASRPEIEFRVGDAERLDFPEGSFDRVLMNFGILHLGDPDRAVTEARRVLRTGGRFGFTVWAPPEESPGARIVSEAVDAHADRDVDVPEGPPYFRFGDREECRRCLEAAGFSGPSMTYDTLTVAWLVPTAGFLFEGERDAGVRTAALLARQTPRRLEAIRAAIESGVSRYAVEGGYALPMAARIISAGVRF